MTTDRPARKPPRLDLSGREWRLVLLTVIAGGYVAAWAGLAGRASSHHAEATAPPPPRVVWLDELAPAERARLDLTLPRGMEIAPRASPQVTSVRRVPGPARFRTRSS